MTRARLLLIGAVVLAAFSCRQSVPGPHAIALGRSTCAKCRHVISSLDAAAQIAHADGMARLYDDIRCMATDPAARGGSGELYVQMAGGKGWARAVDVTFASPAGVTSPRGYNYFAYPEEESPRLAPGAIESLAADAWTTARLVPSAFVRLVALRWNANPYLDSTKAEGHDHPVPGRQPSWVVVYRQSYSVYRREISRGAFRLLADLVEGRSLGSSVSLALRRRDAPTSDTLRRWFAQWAADGLFTRIDVAESEAIGDSS